MEDIDSRFITPYLNRQGMLIDGRFVQASDVKRLTVTVSDGQFGAADRSASGWRAKRREFALRGKDVTVSVLSSVPAASVSGVTIETAVRPPASAREVFVVHGRNGKARDELFELLRTIDLRPLEWEEAVEATGKSAPYIGEILDAAFSRAHAVVVLFTPDDEARLREAFSKPIDPPEETVLRGQARPNVLFEAGMAMARDQDRTILVELGDLRPFSDVAGRHAVRLDGTSGSRQVLAQRLRVAGCPVNLDGRDWHSAGDFDAVLREMPEGTAGLGPASRPTTTEDARSLLMAAVEGGGLLLKLETLAGVEISAEGGENFVQERNARSEARWRRALNELVEGGLVEDRAGSDQMFWVTASGFDEADSLMGSSGAGVV